MPTRTIKIFGNRKLDARPDRLDLRDRPYLPRVVTLPPTYPDDAEIGKWLPAYANADLVLDQGAEGSCTGFGLACVINYLLWRRQMLLGERTPLRKVSMRMLYHLARFYDEWPGEDYGGSSCRGALKAWHRHGVCTDKIWPYLNKAGKNVFVPPSKEWQDDAMQRRLGVYYRIDRKSVVDIQAAILEVGAVYVSADVHDGWDVPARRGPVTGHGSLPVIQPLTKPDSLGGHAFALVGYNPTGFVVQNSWGSGWGRQGFAVLPYDEWVRRGSDAWVCALGVPGQGSENSPVMVGESRAAAPAGQPPRVARGQPSRPQVSPAVAPWTLAEACYHSVVMGNEGRPLNRIVTHENGTDSVRQVVASAPRAWLARQPGAKRIMVYAHGGLNSEDESLNRIRVLAPYFKANGIYPLFLTWKTGPLETLSSILEDQLARVPQPEGGVRDLFERWAERLSDATDRTLEVAAGPVAKPIWSQMKQNAEASVEEGRSTALIAVCLAELASAVGGLEIHVVGHSAGSILLGHFLDAAKAHRLAVRSCSLYAPACTLAFANDHYRAAVDAGVLAKKDLHVHVLSDAREREDAVGPYRKSLLYLVSRALESAHKTPLLGLANVFDARAQAADVWSDAKPTKDAIKTWRSWWQGQERNLHVLDDRQVSTGTKGHGIRAAHGCFDNDAATITATLKRILGAAPQHAIESLDY